VRQAGVWDYIHKAHQQLPDPLLRHSTVVRKEARDTPLKHTDRGHTVAECERTLGPHLTGNIKQKTQPLNTDAQGENT
jgi:hypothetical protein